MIVFNNHLFKGCFVVNGTRLHKVNDNKKNSMGNLYHVFQFKINDIINLTY